MYLFSLSVLVLSFAAAANLLRGRIGRAIVAIRDHPARRDDLGINAGFYKSAALGISAMYAGLAGALAAFALQYVAPEPVRDFPVVRIPRGRRSRRVRHLERRALRRPPSCRSSCAVVGATAGALQTSNAFLIYGDRR